MRNGCPYALLVEDEALVAMFAADALREMGFEVAEAPSASRALALAAAEISDFEIAIVDLGLPDRDGADLVVELKQMRRDLPIIVASGQSAETAAAELARYEKLSVLSKPYQFSTLRASLVAFGIATDGL
jgi:DNA-binding response OmpR family regulator